MFHLEGRWKKKDRNIKMEYGRIRKKLMTRKIFFYIFTKVYDLREEQKKAAEFIYWQ